MSPLKTSHKPIILGSSSKWRAEILRDAGIPFKVLSPEVDEKSIRHDNPYMLTYAIAQAKAKAVSAMVKGEALVIAADQVTVYHGDIREKPSGRGQAREWLRQYRDDCVHVVTAVVVADAADRIHVHGHDTVTVEFREYPETVIEALIAAGDVLKSCGAVVHEDPLIAPYVVCYRQNLNGANGESVITGHRRRDRKDVMSSVSGLPLNLTKTLLGHLGWKGEKVS